MNDRSKGDASSDLPRPRSAEEIFGEACALEGDARAAFVHAACGGDAELEREVLELLARSDPAAAFFDRLGHLVDPLRARAGEALQHERHAEAPAPDLPSGAAVGRYRIIERIGSGGMGTVYRAHDTRLQRDVALKFLPPSLATDPRSATRFLAEARAAAALDHPNICTVHEIGETDDGQPYLAMALYHGETLRARLDRGVPSVTEATAIATAVARGLGAAHAGGIVHRDVKPGNVMLTAAGEVKLLDFGLATAVDAAHTRSHRIYGTAAYMAPEQLRGEPAVPATDLWAVGVMLYEMLSGRRPFEGGDDRELIDLILHADPPSLAPLHPELPARLVAVVERLLRKDPAERYATAAELLTALDGHRAARATPEHVVRRRLATRLAVLSILAGLAAIGVRGDRRAEVPTLDDSLVAVLPFGVMGGDSSLTNLARRLPALIDAELGSMLGVRAVDPGTLSTVLPPDVRTHRRPPTVREAVAAARAFGAGHVVLGNVEMSVGQLKLTASPYDVSSGRGETRVTALGTPESIPTLVDRVVGGLAIVQAGDGDRLTSFSTDSLSALRLALHGTVAFREGRYDVAREDFLGAARIDTGYAFADLMVWEAGTTYPGDPSEPNYVDAWRRRDRLSANDREYVTLLVGPTGPAAYMSVQSILSRIDTLVTREPNSPRAWRELANWIPIGEGPTAKPESLIFAERDSALKKVLALDSALVAPIGSLWGDAMRVGDTAAATIYARRYLAKAKGSGAATMRCILDALASGGTLSAIQKVLTQMDSGTVAVSGSCLSWLYALGTGHYLWESAAPRRIIAEHILQRLMSDTALLHNAYVVTAATERDLGRPSDAMRVEDAALHAGFVDTLGHLATRVRDGLWWDGDTLAATRAAARLEQQLAGYRPHAPTDRRIDALCVLGEWWLAHEETGRAAPVARDLRRVGGDGRLGSEVRAHSCGRLLDAWRSANEGKAGVHDSLTSLAAPDAERLPRDPLLKEGDIIISRLLEREGDLRRALAVLRRDRFALPIYATPIWRREGRLAALLGDTATAIEMYHRFLSFRTDPEPSRQASVTQVKEALATLTH